MVGEPRCWGGRSRVRGTAKLDRASAGEGKRSGLQSRDEGSVMTKLINPQSGGMGVGRTWGWGPEGRRLRWGLRGGRGPACLATLPGLPLGRRSPPGCPPRPGASPAPAGAGAGPQQAHPRLGCQGAKQECLSNSKEVLPPRRTLTKTSLLIGEYKCPSMLEGPTS